MGVLGVENISGCGRSFLSLVVLAAAWKLCRFDLFQLGPGASCNSTKSMQILHASGEDVFLWDASPQLCAPFCFPMPAILISYKLLCRLY